jgi:hypothetical protein
VLLTLSILNKSVVCYTKGTGEDPISNKSTGDLVEFDFWIGASGFLSVPIKSKFDV